MENPEKIEFTSVDEQFFQRSIRMKKIYELLYSLNQMGVKVYLLKSRYPEKTCIKHRIRSFFKKLFK